MGRAVDEWRGQHDDQAIPQRVRLRVFERCGGRCHKCTRRIMPGERWTLEHLTALCNGGEHRESNLCLTCCNCLPAKNAEDVAEKSYVARLKAKHILPRKAKTRPMDGSKGSRWRKRMNGQVERRT